MLKKTITYPDLDGNEITEDFYFHLTEADLARMELNNTQGGGMEAVMKRLIAAKDGKTIMEIFEKIILDSYGVRSEDGKRFIRTPELSKEFSQTEAYSKLFMELVTDAQKGAAFFNGVVPAELAKKVQQAQGQRANLAIVDEARQIQDVTPYEVSVNSEPNPNNMTETELLAALEVPETVMETGLTDEEILALSPKELRTQPRAVLQRAFQLKNQR